VTWNLGDLPAGGAPVALSVQAELVRYAPSITNVATIRTNQSPDFEASWTVSVGTPPALGIPTLNPAALTLLVTLLAMIGLRFVAVRRRVISSPVRLSGMPTAD
jgi:hypothetical protein